MYYNIIKNYNLLSYKNIRTVLYNNKTGSLEFVFPNVFNVLKKCNGKTDIILKEEIDILSKFIDNHIIEQCDFDDNGLDNIVKVYDNDYKYSVYWLLTGKCNYNCKHCCLGIPNKVLKEPTIEEAYYIIDELYNCGIFNIEISGGEPLIYPRFWEIVDRIIDKKMFIRTIYSNGYLIDEEFINRLKNKNIKPVIALSFDGVDGWHEWLRGNHEAFNHINKALDICNKYNIECSVNICVHKGNKNTLVDSINYLINKNITDIELVNLEAKGCGKDIEEYILSDDEMLDLIQVLYNTFYKNNINVKINAFGYATLEYKKAPSIDFVNKYSKLFSNIENCNACSEMRKGLVIDYDGNVVPCGLLFLDDKCNNFGNIYKSKLRDIINNSFFNKFIGTKYKEIFNNNKECYECKYNLICNKGCRAKCYIKNNDMYSIDKKTCEQFKNGFYDKLLKILQLEGI